MKKIFLLLLIVCSHFLISAQNVGIATSPDSSEALHIGNANKGLLIPRMPSLSITLIDKAAKGLMIYDYVSNQLKI